MIIWNKGRHWNYGFDCCYGRFLEGMAATVSATSPTSPRCCLCVLFRTIHKTASRLSSDFEKHVIICQTCKSQIDFQNDWKQNTFETLGELEKKFSEDFSDSWSWDRWYMISIKNQKYFKLSFRLCKHFFPSKLCWRGEVWNNEHLSCNEPLSSLNKSFTCNINAFTIYFRLM